MSEIQSVLFEKRYWNEIRSKQWLKDRNFKYYKIDKTNQYLRYRQSNPEKYKYFRTIKIQPSIKAIVGFK